ncbi:MAG: RNA polymerase sigma factor, partial [Aeoliella sp.]
ELQQRVQHHLESLSTAEKEILLLRHLEQLPMKEIAAVIDVSLGAAQMRYCRALERLHELIGDDSLD